MRIKSTRIFLALAVAGALGVAIFAVLARQATTIQEAGVGEAQLRFDALRDTMAGRQTALVTRGPDGQLQHLADATDGSHEKTRAKPKRFGVLAYRADQEKLVEVLVPFWFVKLKEPTLRLMLREVDFAWAELGLSAEDLERAGSGLVLDERDTQDNALIIWLD